MNAYERLENEACEDGIDVIHRKFSENIKGLYCDGTVAINRTIDTTAEKADVLAEELGHHYTTVGNIIELSDTQSRKQERQARMWGYNKRIGLIGLIRAFEHGCRSRYEIAEYLEVTEQSLQGALDCYRDKYGVGVVVDNYYIAFIPNLMIGKIRI